MKELEQQCNSFNVNQKTCGSFSVFFPSASCRHSTFQLLFFFSEMVKATLISTNNGWSWFFIFFIFFSWLCCKKPIAWFLIPTCKRSDWLSCLLNTRLHITGTVAKCRQKEKELGLYPDVPIVWELVLSLGVLLSFAASLLSSSCPSLLFLCLRSPVLLNHLYLPTFHQGDGQMCGEKMLQLQSIQSHFWKKKKAMSDDDEVFCYKLLWLMFWKFHQCGGDICR